MEGLDSAPNAYAASRVFRGGLAGAVADDVVGWLPDRAAERCVRLDRLVINCIVRGVIECCGGETRLEPSKNDECKRNLEDLGRNYRTAPRAVRGSVL